jgi:SAM domain (Sterile alpha motif)
MRAGEARSSWGAAAMQQVADWLEKLGLGQYAQRFVENDTDFALFTKLTDADLRNSASSRSATESGSWKRSRTRSAGASAHARGVKDFGHCRTPSSHGDVL